MPRGKRKRLPGVVIHEAADLTPADITVVDGIPVTSVARTLIDIAAVQPRENVEGMMDEAFRRRLVSLRWLRSRVGALRRPGRPGIALIERLIAERDSKGRGPENSFERRLLKILGDAGLPEPVCQYEVWDAGRFVARPDFAYPDVKLAIEADSYEFHSTLTDWARDREKGNDLELLGWSVLRFTWQDVTARPEEVARMLRRALRARETVSRERSRGSGVA